MTLRDLICERVFGSPGLPTNLPAVTACVAPPWTLPAASVTRLRTPQLGGDHTSWHFAATNPSGQALICHQGHDHAWTNGGLSVLAAAALDHGCDVVAMQMPGYGGMPGVLPHGPHLTLEGFVRPTIEAVNYLAGLGKTVAMAGLSGGGWTTTIAAAIDERITRSFPIAGTLPKLLRTGASVGDWEQAALYDLCDYPALYALACSVGRRQVQILNRYDSAAFARDGSERGAYTSDYAVGIAAMVALQAELAGGRFEFFEDVSHSAHLISDWSINTVVGPAMGWAMGYDMLIDDGSPGHSLIGAWTPYGGIGCNADVYFAAAGSGSLKSTWAFILPDAGNYEVSVSFVRHDNRATNAPYSVRQNGSTILSAVINQRGTYDGALAWEVLGGVTAIAGSLTVELTNTADGFVIADAARVRKV